MDAASLRAYLKMEFGIENQEQFEQAVTKMKGVDLGIFTAPINATALVLLEQEVAYV